MSIPTMTPEAIIEYARALDLYEVLETWIAPVDMEGVSPQVFIGRIPGCDVTLSDGVSHKAFRIKIVRLL